MENNLPSIRSMAYAMLIGILIGIGISIFFAFKIDWDNTTTNEKSAIPNEENFYEDIEVVKSPRQTAIMLDLLPAYVEDEMARIGRVVRRKPKVGKDPKVSTKSDVDIRAEVFAIYTNDPVLAKNPIKLQSRNGKITLSSDPLPPGHIGRAIALAYDVSGVGSVTSNIAIKPKRKK